MDLALKLDVLAVLGKGHERGQEVNGILTPFDDRRVHGSSTEVREERFEGE